MTYREFADFVNTKMDDRQKDDDMIIDSSRALHMCPVIVTDLQESVDSEENGRTMYYIQMGTN
jgi:hypothetical protein